MEAVDATADLHMVRMFAVDDGIAVTLSNPVTIDDGDDRFINL